MGWARLVGFYSLKSLTQPFLMGGCQHAPAHKKQNEFVFQTRLLTPTHGVLGVKRRYQRCGVNDCMIA